MKVYAAINAVQAALAKQGVGKTGKNAQQGYAFRGIDAVMDALAPILAAEKLCMLPRVVARDTTARPTKSGGVLYSTVLDIEYDLVHAEDGSKHTIRVVGEAMDSADKSCNKSMSAGYKYACIQAFCIPIEGEKDADENTPEETVVKAPDGYEEWLHNYLAVADTGLEPLRKMYGASSPVFREYLTKYDVPHYNQAVANAEAATKKAKQTAKQVAADTVPA
jgi:ERF superfamily protein